MESKKKKRNKDGGDFYERIRNWEVAKDHEIRGGKRRRNSFFFLKKKQRKNTINKE